MVIITLKHSVENLKYYFKHHSGLILPDWVIEDARLECLSRSGMIDWNYTKGDVSNFSIVFLAATIDTIKSIAQKEMLTEVLKNKIVSRFMSYQHEMIVQKLHFNWNWD